MRHKGFIGSFAISALSVSVAVALLIVAGAMLAFDGFPGPSVADSPRAVRAESLSTGVRPSPDLVLDPPSASALEPNAAGAASVDAGIAAQAAPGGSLATAAGAPATPQAAPTETAVPPPGVPVPPTEPPEAPLPPGGPADDPAATIGSGVDELTNGVEEVVGERPGGGVGLP